MRNKAFFMLGACIVMGAFFFAYGTAAAQEGSQDFVAQQATITNMVGLVECYSAASANWQPATVGVKLGEGDKIRTGADGKAELTLEDGSFIRLKPNSDLSFLKARKQPAADTTEYNLDSRMGEIMLELKKLNPGSEFKVQTPTAVAAVRGTTYYIRSGTKEVNGVMKEYVEIFVVEGSVDFANTLSNENAMVPEGMGAIVFDDGTIEGPYTLPEDQQKDFTTGWEMVQMGEKMGMRDVDEEEGEEEGEGDLENEDPNLGIGNQDSEQETYQFAQITDLDEEPQEPEEPNNEEPVVTGDSDGDGVYDTHETEQSLDPLAKDTDKDGIEDFEDAFALDPTIDPDSETGTGETVKGYGSWEELHQQAVDMLAIEGLTGLSQDISDMVDDIHARGYEAVKESIFDHQAGKIMTDRWGNRVRVEEYISKPTDNQVQILALNLRTAGPNAGLSSMDFRVVFDQPITCALSELPWDDYMSTDYLGDIPGIFLPPGSDYDTQIIAYKDADSGDGYTFYNPSDLGYPVPESFSLAVGNPHGDSLRVWETYSPLINYPLGDGYNAWFQVSTTGFGDAPAIELNGVPYMYADASQAINDLGWSESIGDLDSWGSGWNDINKHAILEFYTDESGANYAWLLGAFYLINDDGSLVAEPDHLETYYDENAARVCWDVRSFRDLINPEYNVEMVFFSSEFGSEIMETETPFYLPVIIESAPSYEEELALYNTYRNIDVITIPEIAAPYYTAPEPEEEVFALN